MEENEDVDRNLSAEEVDSDDMAGDLCDSDEDDGVERRAVFKAVRSENRCTKEQSMESKSKTKSASKPEKREKFVQEFDTNVF